jgi:hypothetical protein
MIASSSQKNDGARLASCAWKEADAAEAAPE